TTKLTIIDSKGGFQVFNIVVVVSEKYLQYMIRKSVPSATVYPVMVNKGVFVLNGTVERAEEIPAVLETAKLMGVNIINNLRVPGVVQVQLDVVIAEVSRTELRQMSFSWFYNDGKTFVSSLLTNPSSTVLTSAVAKGAATATGQSTANLSFGTIIAGTAVPGFDSQRLHASVELEAGQTFAIGGLIQHTVNASTSKVPVLGDLPFLGAAFRTVNHNQVESELLILVTPYLVDAM